VPLYVIPPDGKGRGDTHSQVLQLGIAPTLCKLIEVPVPETMKARPIG
jgi:hypothetical protein